MGVGDQNHDEVRADRDTCTMDGTGGGHSMLLCRELSLSQRETVRGDMRSSLGNHEEIFESSIGL